MRRRYIRELVYMKKNIFNIRKQKLQLTNIEDCPNQPAEVLDRMHNWCSPAIVEVKVTWPSAL